MENYVLILLSLMIINNLLSFWIEYIYNHLDRKSKILQIIRYVNGSISLYIWYLMIKLLYNLF